LFAPYPAVNDVLGTARNSTYHPRWQLSRQSALIVNQYVCAQASELSVCQQHQKWWFRGPCLIVLDIAQGQTFFDVELFQQITRSQSKLSANRAQFAGQSVRAAYIHRKID
jgi:hypothetical protein